MPQFLIQWLVSALALGATAWVLPGVHVGSLPALLLAAIVLGFLNAILKPILVLLTLPFTIVTLGIFYFILNAIVFALASVLSPGFAVDGFGSAFLGALLMGLLSWMLQGAFRVEEQD